MLDFISGNFMFYLGLFAFVFFLKKEFFFAFVFSSS